MAQLQKVVVVQSGGRNALHDDCLEVKIQVESGVEFLVSAEGTDGIRITSRMLQKAGNIQGESHTVNLKIGDSLTVKRA